MRSRVLITGASGFIGYHLIESALKAGLEVHAAIRPSSDVSHLKAFDITYVYPNFNDKAGLQKLLAEGQYSYIIHSAGATRAKNQEAYNLINADYTRTLAEASLAADIPLKRFVFLSSLAALGPISYQDTQPITEHTLPNPITSYGKSKLLAEQYLSQLSELPLTTIRPTAVYGPREKDLLILFKTLNQGLDAYIGRKPQRLSFVYAKDLSAATIAALTQASPQKRSYNISDGNWYDRYALANYFKEVSGQRLYRLHLPVQILKMAANALELSSSFSNKTPVVNQEKIKELTAANWYCSIDAAQKDLKYSPQYDLKRGLTETIEWYKAQRWL